MLVYGKNVVNEVVKNEDTIKRAFVSKKFNDKSIIGILNRNKIRIKYMDSREMDRMVDGNHQGIIFDVVDYSYYDIDEIIYDDNSLVVILDHLEDPHNFGAIISDIFLSDSIAFVLYV